MQHKSNVISITRNELRASEWEVSCLRGIRVGLYNGFRRYRAIVFNYDEGLTERQAYEIFLKTINSVDEFKPQFHECVCTALKDWPYPNSKENYHA